MFIQTEDTPNPETMKFLPGQTVMPRGNAEFKNGEDAVDSPLAARLFQIQGVEGVFLGSDFVSISKSSDTDWAMLKPMVLATLMEHLSTGQPIVLDSFQDEEDLEEDDDEITQQIKQLLEERVRPMVAMDGGDITFHSFKDGIVRLKMQGACAGCPSSTATLKSGIENMLQHFVPEVTEVQALEE